MDVLIQAPCAAVRTGTFTPVLTVAVHIFAPMATSHITLMPTAPVKGRAPPARNFLVWDD